MLIKYWTRFFFRKCDENKVSVESNLLAGTNTKNLHFSADIFQCPGFTFSSEKTKFLAVAKHCP